MRKFKLTITQLSRMTRDRGICQPAQFIYFMRIKTDFTNFTADFTVLEAESLRKKHSYPAGRI